MTNSRFSKDSHPPIVPVPEQVQRRAWECAYVLLEDYDDRLGWLDRAYCAMVRHDGPDAIGWRAAGQMLVLFRALVDARV